MADQLYEDVVLELSFNIGNPHDVTRFSLDRHPPFPVEMLNAALDRYFALWRKQTQLLPKSSLTGGNSYLFRKPTVFDENVLVGSVYFATDSLIDHLKRFCFTNDLGEFDAVIEWEDIEIEFLRFGCAKGKIRCRLKTAAGWLAAVGVIVAISGYTVKDPPWAKHTSVEMTAECTGSVTEAVKLAKEFKRTKETFEKTWHTSGNEDCVKLRKNMLNHFLDKPIKVTGIYDDATMDAEKAVAELVGLQSDDPKDLYPVLAKRLSEPTRILVLQIPKR